MVHEGVLRVAPHLHPVTEVGSERPEFKLPFRFERCDRMFECESGVGRQVPIGTS